MSIDNIKTSLDKLRSNLESNGTVDSELKTLLQSLDTDIQQLLKSSDTAAATAPAGDLRSELVERAQGISARLAVKHPHLEPVLREIADTLTNMGI
ncbi:hypothetical protein CFter6_5214 [Collimonas fungivorans]|jgi:1-deoxy-D-xylulose 5-phosphate reductoisomerase|uniref:DUF4404 family protein n=1 Tax=Collimonas fungivorans TaxID=158899 RepID=A0A127PJI7_9BURK|nr:DUF4404 family protein [Collimonas fungivorans]AMO97784.1 hypothetical protein CFter6_5214 [Collimonas fungivorans]